jgi:GH25 family lysozyme M1 (1,4-beta-N-acetylmuramidase)
MPEQYRRYGIDVSHFQNPAAPAGVSWEELGKRSTFAIVRATYGSSPDKRAADHVHAARIEAFQVGLYHFFVASQSVEQQLDVFCSQAVRCGIGKGDILPALDVEDDGPRVVSPTMEPLLKRAADIMVSEFGGCLIYITQRDWHRLGKPAWVLDHPLWVAHYTNGPKPATPGNVAPAIWQYRVGPYAHGAPFVLKEASAPNALDHNIADRELPLCTSWPTAHDGTPHGADPDPDQSDIWAKRLAAIALEGLKDDGDDQATDVA